MRDAAEEETREPAMATAADDDEINPPIPGCGNYLLGGVTEGRFGNDPACALRLSCSARTVKHALGSP